MTIQQKVLNTIRALQSRGEALSVNAISAESGVPYNYITSAMQGAANKGIIRWQHRDYSTLRFLKPEAASAPAKEKASRTRRPINLREEKVPVLAGIKRRQTLKAIGEDMGRSLSTTHTIAQLLVDKGYLSNPAHGRYRLTAKGEAALNRTRQPKPQAAITAPEPPRKRSVWSRIKSVFGVAS